MLKENTVNKIFTNLPEKKETYFENICKEFPFFSLAHFYNLKFGGQPKALKLEMALLHFDNPYLLNYRINKEEKIETFLQENNNDALIKDELPEAENGVSDLSKSVSEIKNKFEETLPENEQLVTFEPLHTTDYFASQGIKLSEEIKPDDKLGKQLRSFTDWLKTMKKVEGNSSADPNVDISIQKIAENSNKDEEIITESMAEVYISQGKFNKASAIYKKLSLLNPDKSAYFAAKLEFLKDK